jgi:hypothetical protein
VLALLGAAIAAGAWFALRGESGASIPSAVPVERASSAVIEAPVLAQPELEIACPTIEPESAGATETLAPAVVADERKTVSARPPRPSSLVGRIVDARTGDGLPGIEVTFSRLGDGSAKPRLTDLEGRFVAAPWSSDHMHLQLEDQLTGKSLGFRTITPESLDSSSKEGLVLPVEVGPTLVVRLVDAPSEVLHWRMGLRTSDEGSRWRDLMQWRNARPWGSEGLWMARYRKLEFGEDEDQALTLCVSDPNLEWEGQVEVEGAIGVHTADIHILAVARLAGRVIDEDGQSVLASVAALRKGERRSAPAVSTEEDGTWSMKGLVPGPTWLLVRSEGRLPERVQLDVQRGENPAVEIVLPRLKIGGDISGTLIGPADGQPPMGILVLDSVDPRSPSRDAAWVGADSAIGSANHFTFSNVLEGSYELRFQPFDGRTFEPQVLTVSPPANVEFETREAQAELHDVSYELHLRDALSGEELSSDGARILRNDLGYWSETTSAAFLFSFQRRSLNSTSLAVVVMPGYKPACARLPAIPLSRPAPEAPLEVQVDLEPGHGAALVVLDGESAWNRRASWVKTARGLPGARVVSRGKLIGTTDELGLALCRSDRPIRAVEIELDGWVAVERTDSFRLSSLENDGEAFVYMVRSD